MTPKDVAEAIQGLLVLSWWVLSLAAGVAAVRWLWLAV